MMRKKLKMAKNENRKIIAIDGPSSSGKGTLAKKVAKHYNLPYLNTGAIYRLIAFRANQQHLTQKLLEENYQEFQKQIPALVQNIRQEDLENDDLFNEEIGKIASIIAKNQLLRKSIFDYQQEFVSKSSREFNGCVIEGRDTTTVIAPNADYKFYIKCDAKIRAKRRQKQLEKNGIKISFEEIMKHLIQRDDNDINRKESPLKIAEDAVIIDNGKLSIQESLEQIINRVK